MGRVKDLLPDDWEGPDYGDEPACDHEDYEVDWNGRATCDRCHEGWNLTAEEFTAYQEVEARWHEEYDAMQRRESSWWFRAWCWMQTYLPHRRPPCFAQRDRLDDEIPF